MDIKNVFVCPKCKIRLTDELECLICKSKYTYERNIYNFLDADLTYDTGEIQQNDEINDSIEKVYLHCAPYIAEMEGLIIDYHAGNGRNLSKILKNNRKIMKDILCVDNQMESLVNIGCLQKIRSPRVHYMVTNDTNLAIRSNCADYVSSFAGIELRAEFMPQIKEIYRILKPEGKLFYVVKSENKGKIEDLLIQAGFRNVQNQEISDIQKYRFIFAIK